MIEICGAPPLLRKAGAPGNLALEIPPYLTFAPLDNLKVQHPGGAAGANSSTSIPTEIQARLNKLQSESRHAAVVRDAKKEAGTLDAMGNIFMGMPEYRKALDVYGRALIPARRAKDAKQEVAALNGIAGCYRSQSLKPVSSGIAIGAAGSLPPPEPGNTTGGRATHRQIVI